MNKKYLTDLERRQRLFDIFNGLTFEYTRDLSGNIIIHTKDKDYSINDINTAKNEFINNFLVNTQPKLDNIIDINNLKFIYG